MSMHSPSDCDALAVLLQVIDRVRARVKEVRVIAHERQESDLPCDRVQFAESLNFEAEDFPDDEFAQVTEHNRICSRADLRHLLVDHVAIAVDLVRVTSGDSGSPQRTTVLVEQPLKEAQRLIVEHILRTTTIGRVDAVLQVDEVGIADGIGAVVARSIVSR